mgnify:CR=1 FL=1
MKLFCRLNHENPSSFVQVSLSVTRREVAEYGTATKMLDKLIVTLPKRNLIKRVSVTRREVLEIVNKLGRNMELV